MMDALVSLIRDNVVLFSITISTISILLFFLFNSSNSNKNKNKKQLNKAHLKSKSTTQTVLLVGPPASGKTALFSKLLYGQTVQSYTSINENNATISVNWSKHNNNIKDEEKLDDKTWPPANLLLAQPLNLIDIPGHPRLRTRSLAKFLPKADRVVFTIDAHNGLSPKNIRDAADHLNILLTSISLLSQKTNQPPLPLLILLTKSDLLSSTSTSASSSTPSSPSLSSTTTTTTGTGTKPKSLPLLLSRARQSLARELERHRQSSSAAHLTAGARLEGLDAVVSDSTTGGGGGGKAFVKSLAAIGGAGRAGELGVAGGVIPSDEAELLATEAFVLEGGGPFEWDKVEGEIGWAFASVKDVGLTGKLGEGGLEGFWKFVEEE